MLGILRPGDTSSHWQIFLLALAVAALAGGGADGFIGVGLVVVVGAFLWVLRGPRTLDGPPD